MLTYSKEFKLSIDPGIIKKVLEAAGISLVTSAIALPFFKVVIVLIIIDFLTGLLKSWACHKMDSSIGQKGCIKVLVYLSLISASSMISGILGFGIVDDFCMAMISITEFTSILENLYVVEQKYKLKIPFINSLINFSKLNMEKLNKYLDKDSQDDK